MSDPRTARALAHEAEAYMVTAKRKAMESLNMFAKIFRDQGMDIQTATKRAQAELPMGLLKMLEIR
jgi:hypothetical protein